MNSPLLARTLIVFALYANYAVAGDWMTWRSSYTHDPLSGHRVDQYAMPVEPIAPDQGNLVRSGYRHYRSTIQAGESADNLHIVNEWGRPVMPYEHWRFPFRPYGVPYDAWGPQTPNVLNNFSFGLNGYSGQGYGGQMPHAPPGGGHWPNPGYGAGSSFPLVPPYQPAPWNNGLYPSARPLNNQRDPQFFYRPPSSMAP